jgi:hypothetical protein
MALVEDDRIHATGVQGLEPLSCSGAQQLPEVKVTVLRTGDLALERRGDLSHLAVAPTSSLSGPARGVGVDLIGCRGDRLCALGGPSPPGEIAEGACRVVELTQRLVRQHRDRARGVRCGHRPVAAEQLHCAEPLRLDRGVRNEDEGGPAEPSNQLDPDERLAGSGRRNDVAAPSALGEVVLDRLEGELLIAPPTAAKRELLEAGGGHSRYFYPVARHSSGLRANICSCKL